MFDNRRLHGYWEPPATEASRSVIAAIVGAARAENRAAARRLRMVAELFEMRRAERGEQAQWAVDTWAAVGAEIAAALGVTLGRAGSAMTYGLAMLELPAVAARFETGDIDLATYRAIVYRTGLITDGAARAEVDRQLADRAVGWPSMSQGRLTREIDRIIDAVDPDAVRRVNERARDRDVTIWDARDGSADVSARLFATDAEVLDKRLDALAATVCEDDPRTVAQRRADSLGALAAGADRLMCRCGNAECSAAVSTPTAVVIHVVAEQSTLERRSERPGHLLGADALVPAELLRELAATARLRPLSAPAESEPRYRPSQALADFVRARDLTCRAPGCDKPAVDCDLDHTVPYASGGYTHASNIKCLCRFHHILKTFWGWKDQQLPDGTIIWTLPDDQTYTTTPGTASLLPTLTTPTLTRPTPPPRGDRTVMMPRRRATRAHNRAQRIAAERAHNRRERHRHLFAGPPPDPGDDPPPF